MEAIRKLIYKQVAEGKLSKEEAKSMLFNLSSKKKAIDEDVAIIGVSAKLPGADDLDDFWSNLKGAVCDIKNFPARRRKDIDVMLQSKSFSTFLLGYPLPDDINPSEYDLYNKGGYLDEIDKFDAGFFNIPPKEAKYMSPLQRLLLENSWETIEDAGYGGDKIFNTRTGVFIGYDNTNMSLYKYITMPDPLHETGSYSSILASRVSYLFNLQGPAMIVDTACSSSLVALHIACQSLKNNECDMAIAGGIYILYKNFKNQNEVKANLKKVTADDGKVRTFDKNAKGTVWSEGVGTVLLKPLKKAIEDGDNIYAVIKGSAVNNDGLSNGITAPSAEAQEDVIVRAWKDAGIDPETISYVESHGTGTIIGDPIEVKGLTEAFKRYTNKTQFCGIGSLKPNIGHLVAASGIASVVKLILALKNEEIPASINFEEANTFINFVESPIYVNDKPRKWAKAKEPRRAGVSSFGFSGTNCHMVIEEAPAKQEAAIQKSPCVLTISARSKESMNKLLNKYLKYLNKNTDASLKDICYTAATGRGHHALRLAFIASSIEELKEKVSYAASKDGSDINSEDIFYGEHKIIFGNKSDRLDGEITEKERKKLSDDANKLVDSFDFDTISKNDKLLKEICELYIKGALIQWDKMYSGNKVNLPVYPYDKVRYWAESVSGAMEEPKDKEEKQDNDFKNTLIDKWSCDSMYQGVFETNFDCERHWILQEHKIMSKSVVPGTAQLDMIRSAGMKYLGEGFVEIKDVVFLSPIIVNEFESKQVQLIFKKENGYFEFVLASKNEQEEISVKEVWTTYTQGKVYKLEEQSVDICDVEGIKSKCNVEVNIEASKKPQNMVFGPRWNNIVSIHSGENSSLIYLELPSEFAEDDLVHQIHPALLDNAVNAMAQHITDERDLKGMYLPLSYKNIKWFGKMPQKFYSYARRVLKDSKETKSFDISLIDLSGKVFAEIKDYTIKRVNKSESAFGSGYGYELGWVEKSQEKAKEIVEASVLIIKDQSTEMNKLSEAFSSYAQNVYIAELGTQFTKESENKYSLDYTQEDFDRLTAETKKCNISHILFLSGKEKNMESNSHELLDSELKSKLYSFFYLVKALVKNKYSEDIKISVIGEYAEEVLGGEQCVSPINAALFGLAKVAGQEYSQFKIKCIDIDNEIDVQLVSKEALLREQHSKVAYRKQLRYVEQFREIDSASVEAQERALKEDGVYIVTGGLGGIGLEVSKHLASLAKVKLALINRSKLPERETWTTHLEDNNDGRLIKIIKEIEGMEEKGAKVECISADITDYKSTELLIKDLIAKYGRINGIVHSAGVAGDGFIFTKDEDKFSSVLAPKIKGTWNLDTLTRDIDMDFLALFSSITAVVGGAGQGDYAAANSYMDIFATHRNRTHGKTVSIDWPAWLEVGMAAQNSFGQGQEGLFKPIDVESGLYAFDRILSSNIARIMPVQLNFEIAAMMADKFPIELSDKIKNQIEKIKSRTKSNLGVTAPKNEEFEVIIKGTLDGYTKTQEKLAQTWGRILELHEVDIYENFYSLGGDSILAAQLIKELDKEYPGVINIADIFSYPSIAQLADYIEESTGQKTTKDTEEQNQDDQMKNEEDSDEDEYDSKLKALLDNLESGDETLENALDKMKK